MREHLEKNSLLNKYRSAYRKFFSTETALAKATNDLLLTLDRTKSTFYIGLDLSAAFDTQYVSEKTHRSGGILDHIVASNNISINLESNSFITSSDHSFICFSLSSVKQRKSQQCLMYRKCL